MRSLHTDARQIAGATLFKSALAPSSAMLNRVVGLGLEQPATEAGIAEILQAMAGVRCFVAVSPFAEPKTIKHWLQERALEPGRIHSSPRAFAKPKRSAAATY